MFEKQNEKNTTTKTPRIRGFFFQWPTFSGQGYVIPFETEMNGGSPKIGSHVVGATEKKGFFFRLKKTRIFTSI